MRTFEIRANVTRYRTPEEELELLDAGVLSYDAKLFIYVGQIENFYQGHALLDNEFYSVLAKKVLDKGMEFLLFNEYEMYSVTCTNQKRDINFFVRKIKFDSNEGYYPEIYGFGKGNMLSVGFNTLETTEYVFNQFAKFLPKQNQNNLKFAISKICGHDSRVINLSEKTINLLNDYTPIIYCNSKKRREMRQLKFYYLYICAVSEFIVAKLGSKPDVEFENIVKKYLQDVEPKMNEYKIKLYQKFANDLLDIQQSITESDNVINFGLMMANMAVNYDYFADACAESVEEFIVKGIAEVIDDSKLQQVVDAYLDIYKGDEEPSQKLVEYAYSFKFNNEQKETFVSAYAILSDYCNKTKNLEQIQTNLKKCLIENNREASEIKDMIDLSQFNNYIKS